MARFTFKLPDIGEGITESEIATWRVAVGDSVVEDQPLVDMLTEKAAVEIPSPVAGVVIELFGREGDKVAVGAALIVLEVSAVVEEADEPAKPAAPLEAPVVESRQAADNAGAGERAKASPAVRKYARECGVALSSVNPTGPRGNVTREDLDRFMSEKTAAPKPAAEIPRAAPASAVGDDLIEEVRIIGLRRKIAERMQKTAQAIPHFTYVEEVDVTELEQLRLHLNEKYGKDRGKLTLLPFLSRAIVNVRSRFPQINATFDDQQNILYRHSAVHIGIATQTPSGLIVPVLRHAEKSDFWETAFQIRRLAAAAREGKATREELSGSTITITSLGAMGGIVTTPIINAPEVAIVGVNKMVERPVYRNGHLLPRLMMNLSSSFDHRIVDGWDAAEFIQAIRAQLENPATLLI